MLCAVSTSSGATMPGKITMSDKPRIGRTSGKERDEIRETGAPASPELTPRILMNSVSGVAIVLPI
jgi:hypothetical protein